MLVIITGPSRNPDSSTQAVPVISPLPFCENQAANTWSEAESFPRGQHRRHAGAYGTLAHLQFTRAGYQRGMAHGDADHIGDGVQRPGRAVEGNSKSRARGFSGAAVCAPPPAAAPPPARPAPPAVAAAASMRGNGGRACRRPCPPFPSRARHAPPMRQRNSQTQGQHENQQYGIETQV